MCKIYHAGSQNLTLGQVALWLMKYIIVYANTSRQLFFLLEMFSCKQKNRHYLCIKILKQYNCHKPILFENINDINSTIC